MKLIFSKDHLSIKKFNSVELPALTVLTGLNGSGKSHLLEGIFNGAVSIDGASIQEIVSFNSATFYLDAETDTSTVSILGDRMNLVDQFKSKAAEEIEFRKQYLPDSNFQKIRELAEKIGKHIYDLSENDFRVSKIEQLFNGYRKYRVRSEEIVKSSTPAHLNWYSIWRLVHKINKPISEITSNDIELFYTPVNQKNNFLITQLGKAFINYYDKWEQNQIKAFYNAKYNKSHSILDDNAFKEKYGAPPWEIVNSILSKFSSLDYAVNYPANLERTIVFRLKLRSKTEPNLEIGFEHLSSGEKTMLALVSCMYKSTTDTEFPKVLLLDEIDASLHPSMVNNLFDALNLFVNDHKMNVILVTHSPSTVALAPKESVYLMNKSGLDRIVKTTNEEALNILTEGFASLTTKESSLRLSYILKKSTLPVVLTEGITDRIILETAWQKLYGIEMPFEVQDYFDANSLRTLITREEIFNNYPSRKFISVFDFDQGGYDNWAGLNKSTFEIIQSDPRQGLSKKHKTKGGYAILLPVPDNSIQAQVLAEDGTTYENKSHLPIELLFYGVEVIADRFVQTSIVGGGKMIEFKGNKTDFAENVVPHLSKDAFKNFEPLFNTIKSILA